jgi:hypothetical protein
VAGGKPEASREKQENLRNFFDVCRSPKAAMRLLGHVVHDIEGEPF